MAEEFGEMLRETLEKMRERIEITSSTFDAPGTTTTTTTTTTITITSITTRTANTTKNGRTENGLT